MLFIAILSALSGDERNCAEEIFENYYKLIYKIAFGILNKKEDTEDILNDVMVSVMTNIKKFICASRNEIIAQIVIYSRNAALNLYNKNNRRYKSELSLTITNEDNEYEDIELADSNFNVEDIILSKETEEIVQKYLNCLPVEYRDVIKLVYGLGYSNIEAAQVLHITPNAVGLRLFKAKKKLLKLAGDELSERIR